MTIPSNLLHYKVLNLIGIYVIGIYVISNEIHHA